MTRSGQFAWIDSAKKDLLRWAEEQGIPLHQIEFVVPFVDTDFSLTAWFFFETDEQLRRSGAMGWPERLSARFTRVLAEVRKDPAASRRRLYLDALGEILPRFRRTVVVAPGQDLDLNLFGQE